MLTCYACGRGIRGAPVLTNPLAAARATGFDYRKNRVIDLDFPKAYHAECYARGEVQAGKTLANPLRDKVRTRTI